MRVLPATTYSKRPATIISMLFFTRTPPTSTEELNREIRTQWGERGEMLLSYIDKSASAWTTAQQLLSQGQNALAAGAEHEQGVQEVVQSLSMDRIKAARAGQPNDAAETDATAVNMHGDEGGMNQPAATAIQMNADDERQRKQLLGNHYWAEPPTVNIDQIMHKGIENAQLTDVAIEPLGEAQAQKEFDHMDKSSSSSHVQSSTSSIGVQGDELC